MHGVCKEHTTKCLIKHNKSIELGHGHKDYNKPCECEDRDNCAPREGFSRCQCPSKTDESRWNFATGEPSL